MTKASRAVLMLLAACAVFAATTDAAEAKVAAKKEARQKKAAKKAEFGNSAAKLGTDFSFSDADVRGKYQSAGEGVVTVENEKDLMDLLGARRHFKDRLAVEAGRK